MGGSTLDALHRITRSSEMKEYSVAGDYDRPIARRIVEEAGVERHLFGQRNIGGAGRWILHPKHLTPDSRRDYEAFCRQVEPLPVRLRLGMHDRRAASGVLRRLAYKLPLPFGVPCFAPGPSARLVFHSGFDRIKQRYSTAVDTDE